MVSLIITLLTAIAPLITTVGLKLIDMFVTNQNEKQTAQRQFLEAIRDHLIDALKSVNLKKDYDQQVINLTKGDDDPTPPKAS